MNLDLFNHVFMNPSTVNIHVVHELDRFEIDLSQKRSECERTNANRDRSKRVWVKLMFYKLLKPFFLHFESKFIEII